VDDTERYDAPPLMCITEEQKGGMGVDERVSISMISICPSTGDVVYDDFEGRNFEYIAARSANSISIQTRICASNLRSAFDLPDILNALMFMMC
jgi:hypothetical protein